MTLLLQAAPLLLLAGLLAARFGPVPAVAAAIALALPAAWVSLPAGAGLAGFLAGELPRAVWLAFIPVAVVAGGLAFHEGVSARREAGAGVVDSDPLFTAAFLLGPFAESVTGFGVGMVFALTAARRAGVRGAPAVALALFALVLVPWGGLGPGTALGAALAQVDVQAMTTRNAWYSAAWLLTLLPLFWRIAAAAGQPVPAARRTGHLVWVAALGAALIGSHKLFPFEIAGIVATGPLLAIRLARITDLRSPGAREAAWHAVRPYAGLTAALLATRLWADPPTLAPYPGLLPLPLTHASVVLWAAALVLMAGPGCARRLGTVLRRAGRPALTILLYVVLAQLMAGSGASRALAIAFAAAFGAAAPYASPLLAAIGGLVAGTNVGSNATMMPVQAELGRIAALPDTLLPAVQNFAGSASCLFAPQILGIATALAPPDDRPLPDALWRLMWPALPAAVIIGFVAVALGG